MLCLRQGAVLLLRRATHPLDPWSGHIAFPGGRLRTREERWFVGIDYAFVGLWTPPGPRMQ